MCTVEIGLLVIYVERSNWLKSPDTQKMQVYFPGDEN